MKNLSLSLSLIHWHISCGKEPKKKEYTNSIKLGREPIIADPFNNSRKFDSPRNKERETNKGSEVNSGVSIELANYSIGKLDKRIIREGWKEMGWKGDHDRGGGQGGGEDREVESQRRGPLRILIKRPWPGNGDVWLLGKFWHKIPTGLSRHAVPGWRCRP